MAENSHYTKGITDSYGKKNMSLIMTKVKLI